MWILFLYTIAAIMGYGHADDGVGDPHPPGGRGPSQHVRDGMSYYKFYLLFLLVIIKLHF